MINKQFLTKIGGNNDFYLPVQLKIGLTIKIND